MQIEPSEVQIAADMDATALDSAIILCEQSGMADTARRLREITTRTDSPTDAVERASAHCPICGSDEPHNHTKFEIEHDPRYLRQRLERLVGALEKQSGFSPAAYAAWGITFGHEANNALLADLKQVLKALPSSPKNVYNSGTINEEAR